MNTQNRVLLLLFCLIASLFAEGQETKAWWESGQWKWPVKNPQAKQMPQIKVVGNKFLNEKGDTLFFRGLAVSDPDKVEAQGYWNKKHFQNVKNMGANLVRIPVHPIAWRERTPDNYLTLLDSAVSWCTDLEMYVMIDWHSIGNLGMELFQNPMYDTTQKETFEFWKTIASHFNGHNTVAFYEIFNEPTLNFGKLGSMRWSEWKNINEKAIQLIRAYDTETIPLVAGLDWAYDLTPILIEPINAEGIGYTSHPYEHKRKPPWEPKWEENFGFAAGKYPVVVTEFGFGTWLKSKPLDENHYAYKIVDYLESKGISWVCWIYDPEWGPQLLKSWEYDLTESGEFFKKAINGKLSIQQD